MADATDLILSDDDFDAVREQLRAAWRRVNPGASDEALPEVLTFATEVDLPDSCFAHVPDGPKSDRKLRLCSVETGKPDAGIVGAAAAALGPGYRGQKVQLPSGAKEAAVRKVRAAWRKVNPDKDDDEMPSGIHMSESGVADAAPSLFVVRHDGDHPGLTLFQPIAAGFADPPLVIPFLPRTGTYQHPLYGDLDFSKEKYQRIVANIKNGVYQERIPINAEHDAQSSGALGWILDADIFEDGDGWRIDATKVEWTQRGRDLIEDDRFRYVSAELFDFWTDPVSGVSVPDVAVGLALTTHPYFKESVLRPLAASEAVLTRVSAGAPGDAGDPGKERTMPDEPTTTTPEADSAVKQLTERILAELGGRDATITSPLVEEFVAKAATELAEKEARATAAEQDAKTLREQNAILQATHRVKVFTDEVTGRSAENGAPYVGHIPDMVKMLCGLAERFGPDSWEVQHYKQLNRAHAEQIKAGSLFTTIGVGRGGDATQSTHEQIVTLAQEVARSTGKTEAQAYAHVLETNSELRAALARERQGGR